jgi:amino acid permease
MNPLVVVLAMINGMIGGLILVLPILTKQGGTVLSFIVITITGFFSYYSCALCVKHLGSHSDLDRAIYYHFGESKLVRVFYDLMVFSNLILIELLYFNLIVQQWDGLFAPSIANPLCNIIFLFILIFVLKYVHFGAKLLGYGLISIALYCIFLIWLLASAPSGSNHIP